MRAKTVLTLLFIFIVSTTAFADSVDPMMILNAIEKGENSTVEKLLAIGYDIDEVYDGGSTKYGVTALVRAVNLGNSELVDVFLKSGADTEVLTGEKGDTALLIAAGKRHIAIVETLLKKGADINKANEDDETALTLAYSNLEMAKLLIANGVDLNAQNKNGETALIKAAAAGHFDVVKLLLDNDADIELITNKGESALDKAQKHGHKNIVKLINDLY